MEGKPTKLSAVQIAPKNKHVDKLEAF